MKVLQLWAISAAIQFRILLENNGWNGVVESNSSKKKQKRVNSKSIQNIAQDIKTRKSVS